MAKKTEQLTLDELRDKSAKSKTKLSFGKEMGGYNKKQVSEYIDTLTENLRSAEESFNNRLEEYSAMITMLKQERDQYGEMYNLCKASKFEMSNQIDELKKENEALNRLVEKLNTNQNSVQVEQFDIEDKESLIESQNKLDTYLRYEQESNELKDQLDKLKSMVRDLNDELETYATENLKSADPGIGPGEMTPDEMAVLKSQYDDILRERSALLTEKIRLVEENTRLTDDVSVLNEQLNRSNEKCNTRIQEFISIYQSNTDEYLTNHQNVLVQLTEHLKNSLDLIKAEGDNLASINRNLIATDNN